MLLHNDFTITQNQFGFSGLMDMFWVDQPGASALPFLFLVTFEAHILT